MASPSQQRPVLFSRAMARSRYAQLLVVLLLLLPLAWSSWGCTLGSGLDLPSGRAPDNGQGDGDIDIGNRPPGDGDSSDGESPASGGTGGVHTTAIGGEHNAALGGAHPCGDAGAAGAEAGCNDAH